MFVPEVQKTAAAFLRHPVYFGIVFLFTTGAVCMHDSVFLSADGAEDAYVFDFWSRGFFFAIFYQTVFIAAIIFGLNQVCRGEQPRHADGLAFWAPRFLHLVVAFGVFKIATQLGFLLLFFPGLYILSRYSFMMPILVLGKHAIVESATRSVCMTEGWKTKLIVVYGMFLIVPLVVGILVFVPLQLEREVLDSVYLLLPTAMVVSAIYMLCVGVVTLYYFLARYGTWDLTGAEDFTKTRITRAPVGRAPHLP